MISGGLNLDVSWRAVNATGEATWAAGIGNGGNYVAWDRASGVVIAILASEDEFAGVAGDTRPGWPIPIRSVIEAIQQNIAGANPLSGT
jgi:hypothetical protein